MTSHNHRFGKNGNCWQASSPAISIVPPFAKGGLGGNTVELRSRSASLCRQGTRFVSAAKGCRPTIWFVSVLNSTVLGLGGVVASKLLINPPRSPFCKGGGSVHPQSCRKVIGDEGKPRTFALLLIAPFIMMTNLSYHGCAVRKVLDVILVLLFMEFCFFLFKLAMRWFPA